MSKRDSFLRYRLRRLALEAGDFTASELASLGDVEKGTVEGFLSDLRQEVPNAFETEKIKEFRVGRPSVRYRLTEEASRYLAQSNLALGRQLLGAQKAPAVMAAAVGAARAAKAPSEESVRDWVKSLGQEAHEALLAGGSVTVRPERPVTVRFRDKVKPVVEGITLSVEELFTIIKRILTPWQLERLETRKWTEASYKLGETGAFCLRADWISGHRSLELCGLRNRLFTIEQLLLPEAVPELAGLQRGLILVSGIEKSGRSVSIAAMVEHVSKEESTRISMIEEPAHYFFPKENLSVEQKQVAIDVPDFNVALEGALHKEARFIALSDVDAQTFSLALEAAERNLIVCRISAPTPSEAIQKTVSLFPSDEQMQVRERMNRALKGIISIKSIPSKQPDLDAIAAETFKWRPEVSEVVLNPEKTSSIYEVFARYPDSFKSFGSSIRKLYEADRIEEETLENYMVSIEPRAAHR